MRMKRKPGFILALVLIFMLVLFSLAGGIAALSYPEYFFINKHSGNISALHVADAGLQHALYRMQTGNFGNFSGTLTPSLPGGAALYGTYNVTITADPGNSTDTFKMYQLVSSATLNSRLNVQRTVRAVAESTSFGRYGYFTDLEKIGGSNNRIWFKMGDQIDGPIHSNDQISINWNNYSSNPAIFLDRVTTSNSSFYWNPRQPAGSEWNEVFLNGTGGFETGVAAIPFPPATDVQKSAALSGMAEPTGNGVYLPNAGGAVLGGVYVRGTVQKVLFSVDGFGNQVIQITQKFPDKDYLTTITMNESANTTVVNKPDGSSNTYTGQINGVIYCTQDVQDLSGTVKARLNLTTENTNTVTIKNHLRYYQDPRTNPDFNGVLGVVSGEIILASTVPSDIVLQAALLAGKPGTAEGSFYYQNYDQDPVKGSIRLLGGLVQEVRGAVGTFSSYTGQLSTGFSKDYRYDTRLALRPPPYFPTTGKYRIRFWKDLH